jgi:uncharacterized protein (TIGR03067 family)
MLWSKLQFSALLLTTVIAFSGVGLVTYSAMRPQAIDPAATAVPDQDREPAQEKPAVPRRAAEPEKKDLDGEKLPPSKKTDPDGAKLPPPKKTDPDGEKVLPPDTAAMDREKMQGRWKVTYAAFGDTEGQAKVATRQQMQGMTITIEGNKLTYSDSGFKETVHFTLKPAVGGYKVIEFTRGPGDDRLHWHGVYEFAAGKIKLCWGPAEATRPMSFSPRKNLRMYTIERK